MYIQDAEDQEGFKGDVIERYLDDEIDFETLRAVIGRQDAASVRASKALLDDGEELADELASLSQE